MALLNNYYIFVTDEEISRGVTISEHPVESGLDITDNVRRMPKVLSIRGEIVGKDATKILINIDALQAGGKYVQYVGRNIMTNALISNFDTSHPNTIYGGCAFTMELKEVRIAKSPLVVKKNTSSQKKKSSTQQITKKSTANTAARKYTVKKGDTLWGIAKKYYGNGAKYTKIVNANKSKIKNPNLIQIGWVLTIPA